MPVLIYCVAGTAASLNELQTGVAGSPVIRMNVAPLNAYLSQSADSSEWLRAPLRTSALEFHRVLKQLFSSVAIIPFRFPTTFNDRQELAHQPSAACADGEAFATAILLKKDCKTIARCWRDSRISCKWKRGSATPIRSQYLPPVQEQNTFVSASTGCGR